MATAAADVISFPRMGRPSKARLASLADELADARLEYLAHEAEALAFVDAIRPLVDRLHIVAVEIGPLTSQTVNTLAALIDRYESRHITRGDDDPAVTA